VLVGNRVERIVAQVSAFGERDRIRAAGESDRYFQRNHTTTISRNDAAKLPDVRARSPTSGGRPLRQIGGSARGYRGLSARLAISTTDEQAGGPDRMFMHGPCRA